MITKTYSSIKKGCMPIHLSSELNQRAYTNRNLRLVSALPGFPGRFLFFLPAGLVVVVVVELDLELELLLVGLVSAGSGEKALTDGGTANMFADMTSIRKMNI